jgi:hypothetical protein
MPDFADDPSSELERKAKSLKVMALVETVSYVTLFWFWVVQPVDVVKVIVGFFHGLIWLAFAAMTVIIAPAIGWTWLYVAIVIVTGPVGGLMVFSRLQRTPRAVLVPPRSPQPDPGSVVPPPGPA